MPSDPEHDDRPDGLGRSMTRRTMLAAALGTGAAVILAGCGDDDSAAPSTTASPSSTSSPSTTGPSGPPGSPGSGPGGPGAPPPGGAPGPGAPGDAGGGTTTTDPDSGLSAVPEETAGPYPGDGSNGPNALAEDGVVRSDIRSSFGSSSGTADGVPIALRMTIVDVATGKPVEGAAVYVWHCDAGGNYSLYSADAADANYLRGVQATAADGTVTFTSIYPACYAGRWPHIHYEVYPDLDSIRDAGNKIATSQLALPDDANAAVYATDRYSGSRGNYSRVSLETDNVFSDGTTNEVPTVTGSPDQGYTVEITSPVTT
jgi:protocatechuate 3,4-dioxygenase beta subunit